MKKSIIGLFISVALVLTGFSMASALPISTVDFLPGNTQVTTALTTFKTDGADMAGMSIQATFTDGTSQALVWSADTTTAATNDGGVSGLFSLSVAGDTFFHDWMLTNNNDSGIASMLIDAGQGDAVFDTILSPSGTLNSKGGRPFTVRSGSDNLEIEATYMDEVALSGSAPEGDIFRILQIDFTNENGFSNGTPLSFIADTDSLEIPGDIQPIGNTRPVPAPNTMLLLGTGLLGIFGMSRKVKIPAW